jgi:hypothetical protein
MAKIELNQKIAAPPRHVFAFFVPQRMPYWYGGEMDSCFEVQDGRADFAVGVKVRISGKIGSKNVGHTAVVTSFEAGRLFEWRFHDASGVRGRERWQLEELPGDPSAPTHTCVRFISEYEFPSPLGRLLDQLVTRRAALRRSKDYLQRLARLVEGGAEPARSWSVAR